MVYGVWVIWWDLIKLMPGTFSATKALDHKAPRNFLRFSSSQDEENRLLYPWFSGTETRAFFKLIRNVSFIEIYKIWWEFWYIQSDGGIIFDTRTIERMEFLILGALKWRMRSITPFSFILFFISLFKLEDPPLRQALKARATQIIFKAQNGLELLWTLRES